MEENGRLVRFIFNPEREAVTEESGDGVNRLIRASELIAATSDADSARTYYHYASDEMGSITHIVDEAGAVQNRYEYDAWGNITAQEENVPNRFKFTGQQFDPVAQQYYLRARFYNPVVGRFTQEDTYRGDGLNLYAYCANNPIFYRDPTGNTSQCMKDAYLEAKRAGATKEEAYAAAKAAYEKNHTDADPRPQVDVPDDRSMSREEWDQAYRDARRSSGDGNSDYIYRTMKMVDGMPYVPEGSIGASRGLGVRIPEGAEIDPKRRYDIRSDSAGIVYPETGGMSANTSIELMDIDRKPKEFGGIGKDPLWRIKTSDLGPDLQFVPDRGGHGTVQPTHPMPQEDYREALAKTRNMWEECHNDE